MILNACSFGSPESIVNKHAEVMLTKENELQFRFKMNEKMLENKEMYKVRVTIHNQELAAAIGEEQIMYGADEVASGRLIAADEENGNFIYMNPLPLLKDLHVFDIEEMIVNGNAISVEMISEHEVIAKTYLNQFWSQI
ncbi:hypothetical protein F7732_01255 [Bacillus mesophilum]|uniref:Uncharacterized protein n=2 Tax=Bacillus mesophilum TaxID=1071718 RepID=A0A7V7RQY0_9BACI|nr:hypothetical protein F7732_01255 [Bacillus mesophilum]